MKVSSLPLLLSGLLLTPAAALFPKNQSSYLNFVIPQSLSKNGTAYPHNQAHFGSHFSVHAKDANMVQRVYYDRNDTFCSTDAPGGKNGTAPEQQNWAPPYVVLIDRGGCTFVTKVRNAQRRGASAVILADNDDQESIPVVADDGSGRDVSIPSVIMKKSDADTVKAQLQTREPVVAEMAWHWPKHEHNATIDYWYSPNSLHSARFLGNFSTIVDKLGDSMIFRPRHQILDGVSMGCRGRAEKETDACYNLCTNGGRYCAVGHHGVLGKDVVIESLRRMCVDKHYPGKTWWTYVDHFNQQCMEQMDEAYFADENCLKDAYDHASIDQATIGTCMKDSGDIALDVINAMLEDAKYNVLKYGAFESPTVLINYAPITYMPITPKTVFDVYCSAFEYGKAPHACHACELCGDPVVCIARDPMACHPDDGSEPEPQPAPANQGGGGGGGGGKKGHHFWGWFFLVCLVGGAGGYIYYKKRVEGQDGFGSYSLTDAFLSDSA